MRLLITAGPTREPIDDVRFIGNRSSGRMGAAMAVAGRDAGHEVTLLLGPCNVGEMEGVVTQRYGSTAELEALLDENFEGCDVLVMAAAVADYRMAEVIEGKLPREADGSLKLTLVPTPDLVAGLAGQKRGDQKIVAFALEEVEVLETRAMAKMKRKGVDAIVANPLKTMDSDAISAVWLTAKGQRVASGAMSKTDCAGWLMERLLEL